MNTKTIKIKPLSVNDAWQGQRYKTPEYKQFELLQEFINERVDIMARKLKAGQPCGILTIDKNPFKPTAEDIINIFNQTGNLMWRNEEPVLPSPVEPITFESWKENR